MPPSRGKKELRPYQADAYHNFRNWFDNPVSEREALIAFTVGLGKTFTAATCIRYASQKGPVLWLTHREELVDQSASEITEELSECTGLEVEIEKAERRVQPGAQLIVASVPSLKKARLERLRRDIGTPSLIVLDEAHHGHAKTWLRVKLAFPDTKILNLTATPYRADVRNRLNLGRLLGQKNTSDGIRMGYLVPFRHAATIQVKLKGVKISLGDFMSGSLAAVLSQTDIARTCVEAIVKHGKGRRTIVFGANVEHSKLIASLLRKSGMRVAEVYGDTPTIDRKSYYAALKANDIDVIVNNMILTEGFNLPEIDLVAILRPTKNASLYLQMLGRGLRTCDGKKECLVIDVVDAPKEKGSKEDIGLPDEEDAKRFASLTGYHFPRATVFLSWFRREADVASGSLGATVEKLNSSKRLFSAVYDLPLDDRAEERMEPIAWLYKKDAIPPTDDLDGYKSLLAFLRSGNIETAINALSISGWKYYPRLDFSKPAETGPKMGYGGLAIRLEALIEDDPQLKNFIADIFDDPAVAADKVKDYYEMIKLGGAETVWFRPIDNNQRDLFCYIPTDDRMFFRLLGSNKMFCLERNLDLVKDSSALQVLKDCPDYLVGDGWAHLPMSPRQSPIVAEILGLSDADIKRANISRLVASCLITGKILKKSLSRIQRWVTEFLLSPTAGERDNTVV